MDPWVLDFGWLIGSYQFGIMLGCLTGLIPGFHVNNVALIALSLSPVAVAIGIPLDAVAGIIVACGTVHTFLNYIPSALVGAPDDNMALALLPGLGLMAYLLVGRPRARRWQRQHDGLTARMGTSRRPLTPETGQPRDHRTEGLVALANRTSGASLTHHNQCHVLDSAAATYRHIKLAFDEAQDHIHKRSHEKCDNKLPNVA